MPAQGSIITVTRSNWYDIETVNVHKLVDGGVPEFVIQYKVPHETVGQQEVYTFSYQYTIVDEVGESVVLRFTPAGESTGISGWDEDAFVVTAPVQVIHENKFSLGMSMSM